MGLRGCGEGDLEAEGLDLPDVAAELAGDMGAGGAGGGLAEAGAQPVLRWPFLLARARVPDWRADGHSPAQDTRCPAVGNLVMSRPASAMMARARFWLTPDHDQAAPAAPTGSRRVLPGKTGAGG
jgi:hypothetical protein